MSVAEEKISKLHSLSQDDQLAVLWNIYLRVKENITPEAEREGENLEQSHDLIDKIKGMSKDDQLQIQKDLLCGSDRQEFQTYKSYSSNQRLYFWYRLAEAMEQGSVVEYPSDYQLPSEAQELLKSLGGLDMAQRLTFLRDAISYYTDDSLN